jgi:hypothetical protein
MRYSGVITTCCGSRLPAVNNMSNARLNFSEKRVTAYARKVDSSSTRITAGITMISVLTKYFGRSACCHASV